MVACLCQEKVHEYCSSIKGYFQDLKEAKVRFDCNSLIPTVEDFICCWPSKSFNYLHTYWSLGQAFQLCREDHRSRIWELWKLYLACISICNQFPLFCPEEQIRGMPKASSIISFWRFSWGLEWQDNCIEYCLNLLWFQGGLCSFNL